MKFIGKNTQVLATPVDEFDIIRKKELDVVESLLNTLATEAEKVANKVAISADSTSEQYPTAKSVWDYGQSIAASIPEGLAPPVKVDLESELPDPTTLKIGTFYIIQDMDETAEGHSGKAWVNYADPDDTESALEYYKVYDKFQTPDNESIKLNGTGQIAVDNTWLEDKINTAVEPKIDKVSDAVAGNIATFGEDGTLVDSGLAFGTVARKYATTITGDGETTDFVVTHGFGTEDLDVTIWDLATREMVSTTSVLVDNTKINISVADPVENGQTYRVVIVG